MYPLVCPLDPAINEIGRARQATFRPACLVQVARMQAFRAFRRYIDQSDTAISPVAFCSELHV